MVLSHFKIPLGLVIFLSLLLLGCSPISKDVTLSKGTPEAQENDSSALNNVTIITQTVPDLPSQLETFSLASTSTVIPDDVIDEIAFFGGGGGNLCPINSSTLHNVENWDRRYEELNIYDRPEFNAFVTSTTCGWKPDEKVQLTMEYPDGRQIYEELMADFDGVVGYEYKVKPGDLLGKYKFTVNGQSGILESSVDVGLPSGPRLYKTTDNQYILLYNFVPDEFVRLLSYDDSTPRKFYAWQTYKVDEKGQLLIKDQVSSDSVSLIYVAVGDQSGEVFRYPTIEDANAISMSSKLRYQQVYVKVDDLNIRFGPGMDYSVISKANENDYFLHIGQSINNSWLQVCCPIGRLGWVINDPEYVNIQKSSSNSQ